MLASLVSTFLGLLLKVLDRGLSGAVTNGRGFDGVVWVTAVVLVDNEGEGLAVIGCDEVTCTAGNRGGGKGRLWSCTRDDWMADW